MPNGKPKCGFCEGHPDPIAVLCETCIRLKIVGICIDCQLPFEIRELRNPEEVRCPPCQAEFRVSKARENISWSRYKEQLRKAGQ